VALVRTDVLEERVTSIIKVTRISKLETAIAVTSNQSTVVPSSLIIVTLMIRNKTFLQNVGSYKSHTAQYPKRQHSSKELNLLHIMHCYSPLKVNWHFRGTSHLHFQGRTGEWFRVDFFLGLHFISEDGGSMFL
jgi:hypothetical protein